MPVLGRMDVRNQFPFYGRSPPYNLNLPLIQLIGALPEGLLKRASPARNNRAGANFRIFASLESEKYYFKANKQLVLSINIFCVSSTSRKCITSKPRWFNTCKSLHISMPFWRQIKYPMIRMELHLLTVNG